MSNDTCTPMAEAIAAPPAGIGALLEVPVMASLVAFANHTRHHFPAAEEPGRG